MGVYGSILRVPGVAAIVLSTLIGRLPIGITGLAILLYVEDVSGSFGSAGLCAGALALGSAAGAPFQGRLVDRRGDGVLVPLALIHAGGLLLIWLLGAASAPVGLLALASLVTGAALPPLSSVLRSRWPFLLEERPQLVASAYALDSVMIELIFVLGPLLTTVAVALVGAQYALVVSAACVLTGTVTMLAGLRGYGHPERTAEGTRALGLGALAAPGLQTLVLASLPVGFALGTLEVVLPAFSDEEGSKELAGVLLAIWSLASGAAGLAYGARPAREALTRTHMRFALLLPAGCAVLFAASSPETMALLVILTGPPDRAADRLAQPAHRARRAARHGHRGIHVAADRAGGRRVARRCDGRLARRGVLVERRGRRRGGGVVARRARPARPPGHPERAAARRLT